jgi:hypothetical protein
VLLDMPIGINDLSILVLHGLRHEDETLSLPEVRGMLNHANIGTVVQAITDAWTKTNQGAESSTGDAAPTDPPPMTSTGASSGPTPAATSGSVTQTFGL